MRLKINLPILNKPIRHAQLHPLIGTQLPITYPQVPFLAFRQFQQAGKIVLTAVRPHNLPDVHQMVEFGVEVGLFPKLTLGGD